MDDFTNEANSSFDFDQRNVTLLQATILEKVQFYYVPFLVAFGTVGNWLSVIVFFSTKLRKLSSSFYLAALAISDNGFLMVLFIIWLNMIDIPFFNRPIICEMSIYLSSVCSFLSAWFVVAFTVERFIAVGYPLKRPSMCTVSRAKIVITCLIITSFFIFIPQIFMSGVQDLPDHNKNKTTPVCGLKEKYKELNDVLNLVDFFLVLILPFFAISFINTSICLTVWKLAQIRKTMTNSAGARTFNGLMQRPAMRPSASIRSQNSQTKVTKMLLIVSTVFLCLNLPSYVLRTAMHFTKKPESKQMISWQHASLILFYTNFGINVVLYCISGQNFRKALVSLCCPKRHKHSETSRATVVSEFGKSTSIRRRTITINGSFRETHELLPLTQ